MVNVWNSIPLEDYELHMRHESVGQLHLLNNLTKKYFEKLSPEIVMFLGIAGGNGLEQIDNTVTRQVFGIDINQNYLDITKKRFKNQIPNLNLINIDISSRNTEKLAKANLIWAALIFEYVEADICFEFINNNIQENGYLVVTIQENNGVSSVSQSGIETIKSVGEIFKLITESNLVSMADKFSFNKIDFEENILPNRKSLKTYTFIKKTTNCQQTL
jgi:16S rRNA A1518/A1519 N6-dimethyltransferase RsmA/KsgA/DIM1 with predicted DNA glycosylase/AP lyase activity